MPSPFPGMDPYLEGPELWPDLHHELISVIRERLNQALRPQYHAMVEDRVYISDEHDPGRRVIIPDVAIQVASQKSGYDGPPAVAEPISATTMIEDEMREARIVIIDGVGRQVITVIEVLSPTNKVVGSKGRRNYELKRQEVLQSPAAVGGNRLAPRGRVHLLR